MSQKFFSVSSVHKNELVHAQHWSMVSLHSSNLYAQPCPIMQTQGMTKSKNMMQTNKTNQHSIDEESGLNGYAVLRDFETLFVIFLQSKCLILRVFSKYCR